MKTLKFSAIVLIGWMLIAFSTFAQNAEKASFSFDKSEHDYGDIPEKGGLATHVFIIKNTGKYPLIVKQVVASCGCTIPEWTKSPIAPGKTGEVKVSYNPDGRPGQFNKSITVTCDNAAPYQLHIKGNVVQAEKPKKGNVPILQFEETKHDFGTISEKNRYADYVFKFKNTGDAPLIISRVQASCGCTTPEWTKEPIQPGREGFVTLTYATTGRIGNFNKYATVYTNEENSNNRHRLTIVGNVVDKPIEPPTTLIDTIAGIGISHDKIVLKNPIDSRFDNDAYLFVKNFNNETVYFIWENVPEHVSIKYADSLKADWPDEVQISIDQKKAAEKRGRLTDNLTMVVKNSRGMELGRKNVKLTAIYLDDFKNLSPLQSVNAPHLDINNTQVEFGEVKAGFLGFGGTKTKEIFLSNFGKSELTIHSISSDDERIHIQPVEKIRTGGTTNLKISVKANEMNEKIDSEITIICNDPKGPIRKIKVTAEKTK